jgi:hypothetical protein
VTGLHLCHGNQERIWDETTVLVLYKRAVSDHAVEIHLWEFLQQRRIPLLLGLLVLFKAIGKNGDMRRVVGSELRIKRFPGD